MFFTDHDNEMFPKLSRPIISLPRQCSKRCFNVILFLFSHFPVDCFNFCNFFGMDISFLQQLSFTMVKNWICKKLGLPSMKRNNSCENKSSLGKENLNTAVDIFCVGSMKSLLLSILVVLLEEASLKYGFFLSQTKLKLRWTLPESVWSISFPFKMHYFILIWSPSNFGFRFAPFKWFSDQNFIGGVFQPSFSTFIIIRECYLTILVSFNYFHLLLHYKTVLSSNFSQFTIPHYDFQFQGHHLQHLSTSSHQRVAIHSKLKR